MTTPTLTPLVALETCKAALERFTGYGKVFLYRKYEECPYEQAIAAIEQANAALAAQPELPEPVAAQSKFIDGNEWGWCSIEHHYLVQEHPYAWPAYETRLLYAKQVFAKQEPLSEIALAHQTSLFYPPDEMIASGIYMQAWRDAEAHHNIGADK